MPSSHTVQLAIKYAGRLRMLQLAGRLGEVARQKAEEEELRSQEEGGGLQEVCDAAEQLQDQPSKHYKSRYDVHVTVVCVSESAFDVTFLLGISVNVPRTRKHWEFHSCASVR